MTISRSIVIAGGILAAAMSGFGGIQAWEWLDTKHDQKPQIEAVRAEVQKVGGDVRFLKQDALVNQVVRKSALLSDLERQYGRGCHRGNQTIKATCQDYKRQIRDLNKQIGQLK